MFSYIKRALDDLLFSRIVMLLWATPVFAIVIFSALNPSGFIENPWLLIIPAVALVFGLFMAYTALFADDKTFEKRLDYLSEGGDWLGLLFVLLVFVVALPIYVVVKAIRAPDDG